MVQRPLAEPPPVFGGSSGLIGAAANATREEVAALAFPAGWVPEPFTLPELQAFSEAVLARKLDKVTFRRRIDGIGRVLPLAGEFRAGSAHRPAQRYRFAHEDTPAAP